MEPARAATESGGAGRDMDGAKHRSRSISHDSPSCGQRLVIQNTFFQLVGRDAQRSATPPRRRVRSAGPSVGRGDRYAVQDRRHGSRSPRAEAGEALCQEAEELLTTVVMRGMPQSTTRNSFLELLDAGGFEGQYDFVYLPTDFGKKCSFGYAFVNLVSPRVAQRFHEVFAGFSQWKVPWDTEAEVGWATLQGLDKHVEKYRNSPVMHESMGDESKPILLKDGVRLQFPAPTRKIGSVKRLRTRQKADAGEQNGEEGQPRPAPLARDGSLEPQLSVCWDYQDTDEELQQDQDKTKKTKSSRNPKLAAPTLLLLPGLEPMVPDQQKLQKSTSIDTATTHTRQALSERKGPGVLEAGLTPAPRRTPKTPPGCFKRISNGSDVDVLSDCSTQVPTSQSMTSGNSGRDRGRSGMGRRSTAPQQQLATSFSMLAGGLVRDTAPGHQASRAAARRPR